MSAERWGDLLPSIKFRKNRLLTDDVVVEAKSGETILEIAERTGVPVGSNCGGVCGCSTCHIYVLEGFESLDEMTDREADRLDLGFDVKLNSRLGCQAELTSEDLVVDISSESLQAYLDENPAVRKKYEQTGVFEVVPHSH